MMDVRHDPRSALKDFLRSIPLNIRLDEYVFITLYCLQRNPEDDFDNLEKNVNEYLSGTGYKGIGAVICVKAVMDRRLSKVLLKLDEAELNLKGMAEFDPDLSQRLLLSMPLKKKYYAQVVERWRLLSNSALSDDNIDYFERNPQNLQQEKEK